ncbi:MAG: GGDEF and EAL domain-containing protein [Ruminococcaceae bacterium]|nr:GGDEF and EAL domain-containing protein [Oscillospiraceae bacterium]
MVKTKTDKGNIKNTLRKISLKRETPKSAFILLALLYAISYYMVVITAKAHGTVVLFGVTLDISSFTGVFSSLSNICLICMVLLFRKAGFILALALLSIQFPGILMNIIRLRNYRNIPGIFSNILVTISVTIIYLGSRRITLYQNSIREQAVTDRITGLPNRFAGGELMQDLIKNSEKFALVSIDINNFKSINDTMGHETGDNVLREIADRWRTLADSHKTGTTDFVGRTSGDEFYLIITGTGSSEAYKKTIDAYKDELERKITIDDCDYYLTACFGYTTCPDDSDVIENLYLFSDSALHEVKKKGSGSRILRFNHSVLNSEKDLEIERKIRSCLSSGKLLFNLQPQYDLEHNLRGFEALARMKDDDGSYISPVEFIPVAEKTGLIDRIDLGVFEMAASLLASLPNAENHDFLLSINVSVRHLMKNNFMEEIRRVISETGFPPHRIEIEITESIMIDSAEKALWRIEEIKKMGMKIAIDDFGTGYSSLSYLNSIPSDLLKIDKAFIDKMDDSDSSKQYVSMIISLGHILGLKVISEGVESQEQLDELKAIGCDYIQGYIWGKPMSPEKVSKLMESVDAGQPVNPQ